MLADRLTTRNLTAGFAVLFAGLSAVFVFDNQSSLAIGGQGGEFKSLAATFCQPLWVDGGQNDRALTKDRMNGQKRTPEQQAELKAYGQDLQNRIVSSQAEYKKSDFSRALALNPLGDHVLAKSIENLSRQGLMLKSDYGWWPDYLVDMGVWGYVERPAGCRGNGERD